MDFDLIYALLSLFILFLYIQISLPFVAWQLIEHSTVQSGLEYFRNSNSFKISTSTRCQSEIKLKVTFDYHYFCEFSRKLVPHIF